MYNTYIHTEQCTSTCICSILQYNTLKELCNTIIKFKGIFSYKHICYRHFVAPYNHCNDAYVVICIVDYRQCVHENSQDHTHVTFSELSFDNAGKSINYNLPLTQLFCKVPYNFVKTLANIQG